MAPFHQVIAPTLAWHRFSNAKSGDPIPRTITRGESREDRGSRRFLSIAEFAKHTGISVEWLKEGVKQGHVQAVREENVNLPRGFRWVIDPAHAERTRMRGMRARRRSTDDIVGVKRDGIVYGHDGSVRHKTGAARERG